MSPEKQKLTCSNLDYLLSQTDVRHHQKRQLDPSFNVHTLGGYSQMIQTSQIYSTTYCRNSRNAPPLQLVYFVFSKLILVLN